jgi:hypothetical protein
MVINIYRDSELFDAIDAETPKESWKLAASLVRKYARQVYGHGGKVEIYQTANRVGFQVGDFRATPRIANR